MSSAMTANVACVAVIVGLGTLASYSMDTTMDGFPIHIITALSICAYKAVDRGLPYAYPYLIKAGLFGKDLNKIGKPVVPESGGVVSGTAYLVTVFLFLPVPFLRSIVMNDEHIHGSSGFDNNNSHGDVSYDAQVDVARMFAQSLSGINLVEMLVALLSICCMLFLGFADDVLVLRWREKLILPFIATLPLLMVYYIDYGVTSVLLPKPFVTLWGYLEGEGYLHITPTSYVDLGIVYYLYMLALGVYCTNAINIYAGVNGLEAGQSVIIGISIIVNAAIMFSKGYNKEAAIILYLTLPFVAVALALLRANWWPSQVFVGDTFCYFAGMTFGVVGILSHTSKTLMLFFIPQWINFFYSVPQLFHLIPIPRHRMPRLNPDTGLIEASRTGSFKPTSLNFLGKLILRVFRVLRLVDVREEKDGMISLNNLTLINFVLVYGGPVREDGLATRLLLIQCICSLFAFLVRYSFAGLVYDVVE